MAPNTKRVALQCDFWGDELRPVGGDWVAEVRQEWAARAAAAAWQIATAGFGQDESLRQLEHLLNDMALSLTRELDQHRA